MKRADDGPSARSRAASSPETVPPTAASAPLDVSIVICTVDRGPLADLTIDSALRQEPPEGIRFEVIVVDNSPQGLARARITARARDSAVPLRYVHEPRRNISHARNAGVAAARGQFLAFVDDDSVAPRDWLTGMLEVMNSEEADIVAGASYPDFEGGTAPQWDPSGRHYTRDQELPNGAPTRTGATCNILLRSDTCFADDLAFNPEFGRTGGEDIDFIRRLGNRGRRIRWCATAGVTEFQPRDRMTLAYRSERYFRAAQTHVRVRLKNSDSKLLTILHCVATGLVQVVFLSGVYVLSSHYRAPVLVNARFKFLTGLGKLLWARPQPFY